MKPGSYVRTRYSAPTELTPQVWETSPVRSVFIDDCLQECLWMLKLSHDYDLLYYAPVFFFSFGCFNRLTLLLSLSCHCLPLLSRFPGVLMDLMSCFLCWTAGRCSFCTMRTSQTISSVNTTHQSRWPESRSPFVYPLARTGTLLHPIHISTLWQ